MNRLSGDQNWLAPLLLAPGEPRVSRRGESLLSGRTHKAD